MSSMETNFVNHAILLVIRSGSRKHLCAFDMCTDVWDMFIYIIIRVAKYLRPGISFGVHGEW